MATVIETLTARAAETGYVVLDTMDLVLLEVEMAVATVPKPDIAHLPKTVEEYRFMVRQRTIERITP